MPWLAEDLLVSLLGDDGCGPTRLISPRSTFEQLWELILGQERRRKCPTCVTLGSSFALNNPVPATLSDEISPLRLSASVTIDRNFTMKKC